MSDKKLRIAIIGAGTVARDNQIPAFLKCERAEVAAVFDRHIERAQALCDRYGIQKAYSSYDDVLGDPDGLELRVGVGRVDILVDNGLLHGTVDAVVGGTDDDVLGDGGSAVGVEDSLEFVVVSLLISNKFLSLCNDCSQFSIDVECRRGVGLCCRGSECDDAVLIVQFECGVNSNGECAVLGNGHGSGGECSVGQVQDTVSESSNCTSGEDSVEVSGSDGEFVGSSISELVNGSVDKVYIVNSGGVVGDISIDIQGANSIDNRGDCGSQESCSCVCFRACISIED